MRRATVVVALGCGVLCLVSATSAGAVAPVPLSVSATSNRHAISPLIYGVNFASTSGGLNKAVHLPVSRWGGNATSRYNYLTDTTNTGSDWFFENILYPLGQRLGDFIAANKAAKTTNLVTLPMIGWVSKQGSANHPFDCSYPSTTFPNQKAFDPYDTRCGNGQSPTASGSADLTADPTLTSTSVTSAFAEGEVKAFVSRYGAAGKGGVSIYELDNEPSLWNSTHHDVHPDPLRYDELKTKSIDLATAVKAGDSHALVLGPSDWGWCAYYTSAADNCDPSGSDHQAHGLDLAPWYLQQFNAASKAAGKRLLDYFDEHFYPQANGVFSDSAGDASVQATRLASTRSLWDPTYTDPSWISQTAHPKLAFIRTMKAWVAKYYPGTKTAITEYSWGANGSINGALAEADVLGIFGREGLDLATMWSPPSASQPGAFAFRMYLNYDGKGAHFGETSVRALSKDQSRLAVYAAIRTKDHALTVMIINKTGGALPSTMSVAGFSAAAKAAVYRYSGAHAKSIVRGSALPVKSGRLSTTYPANSITLLVLPRK